jgi:hypothetical protein
MTQVMRPALSLTQVFLYQQPIDFRKAHLGLRGIIEYELGHDSFAGHLYAFTCHSAHNLEITYRAFIDRYGCYFIFFT